MKGKESDQLTYFDNRAKKITYMLRATVYPERA